MDILFILIVVGGIISVIALLFGGEENTPSQKATEKSDFKRYESFSKSDPALQNYLLGITPRTRIRHLDQITYPNFIAFDFETANEHSPRFPCQVGIAVVKNGEIVHKESHLIKPEGNKYDNANICIHGITPEMTEPELNFPEVWKKIEHYFQGSVIVAHYMTFHLNVLREMCKYYNIPMPKYKKALCTYEFLDFKLDKALDIIGMPKHNRNNAEFDAFACATLFVKLQTNEFAKRLNGYPVVERFRCDVEITYEMIQRIGTTDLSRANKQNPFYNKTVVIGGRLDAYDDKNVLGLLLHRNGARVTKSVSGRTDYLICGYKTSETMINKAYELGVKIISEKEFSRKISNSSTWINEI